jgi:hypothetical protein
MAYAFTPQIGYGGKLEVDTAYDPITPPAATWIQLDGLDDFDISFETNEIETTSRQGTTAAIRNNASYLPGITRLEAHASFVFDPDKTPIAASVGGHGITVYPYIGKLGHWKYTFADTSTWEFTGFMSRPSFNSPREDKATMDVTWRLTKAPIATDSDIILIDTFTGDTD